MLLLPSRASLRSVTPTALADRAKLCKDILSCMRAGDIFSKGETPSPLNEISKSGVLQSKAAQQRIRTWSSKQEELRTILQNSVDGPPCGKTFHQDTRFKTSCILNIMAIGNGSQSSFRVYASPLKFTRVRSIREMNWFTGSLE